jgi:uncharacterized protein Yka (UPF0111/DUF47 family)
VVVVEAAQPVNFVAMFSLKRLLGGDGPFFDLLEQGAKEATSSIDLFGRYLKKLADGQQAGLDELALVRRNEKRVRITMTEALGRTFVTPIDREDIEALSFALYRIPKQVEKTVERMSIYPGRLPYDAFFRQAELLQQAGEAVEFMVKQLRHAPDLEKIRDVNDRLQFAEGEADKVMLAKLKELYEKANDSKELIVLQDLYKMIEQAVDRCRNAGNIVVQIALKNS